MKKAAVVIVAAVVLAPAPVQAQQPMQVSTGWYDTQLVKRMVKKAYYRQSYWTQKSMCARWYSNPSSRFFVKLALVADRMPGVSPREAAGGVYKAFAEVC